MIHYSHDKLEGDGIMRFEGKDSVEFSKAPYATPSLIVYGAVESITLQQGGSTGNTGLLVDDTPDATALDAPSPDNNGEVLPPKDNADRIIGGDTPTVDKGPRIIGGEGDGQGGDKPVVEEKQRPEGGGGEGGGQGGGNPGIFGGEGDGQGGDKPVVEEKQRPEGGGGR